MAVLDVVDVTVVVAVPVVVEVPVVVDVPVVADVRVVLAVVGVVPVPGLVDVPLEVTVVGSAFRPHLPEVTPVVYLPHSCLAVHLCAHVWRASVLLTDARAVLSAPVIKPARSMTAMSEERNAIFPLLLE